MTNKLQELIQKALSIYIEKNKEYDKSIQNNDDLITIKMTELQYNDLCQIMDIKGDVTLEISDEYFNCDHFGCYNCRNRGACYFNRTLRQALGEPELDKDYFNKYPNGKAEY